MVVTLPPKCAASSLELPDRGAVQANITAPATASPAGVSTSATARAGPEHVLPDGGEEAPGLDGGRPAAGRVLRACSGRKYSVEVPERPAQHADPQSAALGCPSARDAPVEAPVRRRVDGRRSRVQDVPDADDPAAFQPGASDSAPRTSSWRSLGARSSPPAEARRARLASSLASGGQWSEKGRETQRRQRAGAPASAGISGGHAAAASISHRRLARCSRTCRRSRAHAGR